jgi:hypothetical protein
MAWGTYMLRNPSARGAYMLRKLVYVGFHWFRVLARQQAAAPYSRSWSFPLFKYHFK